MIIVCCGAKIYFHLKYGGKLESNDLKIDVFLSYMKKGVLISLLLLGVAIIISATFGISSN